MRKFIGAVALAAIALSTVVFIGSAAGAAMPPNKPQITFTDPASDGGLLTSDKVQLTINRVPNAIKTLTCTTTGPNGYSSSGCTTPLAGDKGASTASSVPYGSLPPQGNYTFTAALTHLPTPRAAAVLPTFPDSRRVGLP